MEPLFVTECKFDNKSYYEMVPILRKKPSRNFLIFTPVIILIMIFFLVLWGMSGFRDFSWLIPLPAGCLYFVCFFMEPWLRARSALKAGTKFFKETGFERISFYKDSFQVQVYSNDQLTSTATYSYANIISITITSSLDNFFSLLSQSKLDRTYI
ncbi:hypothetical protein DWX78_15480, partial [Dorea formicigenerans]